MNVKRKISFFREERGTLKNAVFWNYTQNVFFRISN